MSNESVKYIGNVVQVYDQYKDSLGTDPDSLEVYKNIARGAACKSKESYTPTMVDGTSAVLSWEPHDWVTIAIAIAFNLGFQTAQAQAQQEQTEVESNIIVN